MYVVVLYSFKIALLMQAQDEIALEHFYVVIIGIVCGDKTKQ